LSGGNRELLGNNRRIEDIGEWAFVAAQMQWSPLLPEQRSGNICRRNHSKDRLVIGLVLAGQLFKASRSALPSLKVTGRKTQFDLGLLWIDSIWGNQAETPGQLGAATVRKLIFKGDGITAGVEAKDLAKHKSVRSRWEKTSSPSPYP